MKYREVNLLGGFYRDASLPWSSQDTVNWLPVPAQAEGARSPMKLRGVPGLKPFFAAPIPPPAGFFTSTVYPIVDTQALDSSATNGGGGLLFPITEAADSFASIDSGELRNILRTYDWPDEAIDGLASVDAGELRTILRTYDWPDEAVDSGATINSGELRAILITYENWPDEAIDSSGTITGGILA